MLLYFSKQKLLDLAELSLFSEIGKSERCGGLVFTLSANAGDDKDYDRYNVGEHLEKLGDFKPDGYSKKCGETCSRKIKHTEDD